MEVARTTENRCPKGWDAERVRKIIEYYDNQTDEEAVAEIEAAYENAGYTLFAIPNDVADKVRKLLASRQSA